MKLLNITFILFFILGLSQLHGQVIIGKPTLGFTQACASESFNEYQVTFSFSPDTALLVSNQFFIELSDPTGDFTNPTTVYSSAEGEITSSPATITFAFPETVSGEAYKVRVKSTAPIASSTPSVAFAAYYKIQDTPFSINNLIPTGIFCAGGSYLLTIDNPGNDDNDSPLQYPSLNFNWYKLVSATTSVIVHTGLTYEVTEAGTYYAETNYGTCTSNSYSNRVVISESASGNDSEITSSRGNPYCASDGETILSAISANSYQWYKDGELIENATNQTYNTNISGFYTVNIDLGGCSTTASIDLDTMTFTSSLNVEDEFSLSNGESVTVNISTDADAPMFQWILNDVIISGETTSSLVVNQAGDYQAVITQTNGCETSNTLTFSVTEPFPDVENIPNVISPNNDGVNDTWVIPKKYVSGSNTVVVIMSSRGEVVLQTNNYLNNWPQETMDLTSINSVYYYIIKPENNQTKKGSITVLK
ncbi:gliding motility-associated C-terminal domain-containing protein [Tamlana sp. 62-3]|uniref:Gliding motility-associated C-terminal domain-containing protein n=1 Tax=Neotamlana sargassicola TaxID=2883125 RepID=A0A9X1I729_9FLAO|nr:gliding motility-associated C-terminal domain-containing protein [Tamlana sargassicola]MCB4809042.1 gliding motility-associated C-terminal domain-containing protein [Tamlana sargassicola]